MVDDPYTVPYLTAPFQSDRYQIEMAEIHGKTKAARGLARAIERIAAARERNTQAMLAEAAAYQQMIEAHARYIPAADATVKRIPARRENSLTKKKRRA